MPGLVISSLALHIALSSALAKLPANNISLLIILVIGRQLQRGTSSHFQKSYLYLGFWYCTLFVNSTIYLQILRRQYCLGNCREAFCDAAHVHVGEEGLRWESFDQQVNCSHLDEQVIILFFANKQILFFTSGLLYLYQQVIKFYINRWLFIKPEGPARWER